MPDTKCILFGDEKQQVSTSLPFKPRNELWWKFGDIIGSTELQLHLLGRDYDLYLQMYISHLSATKMYDWKPILEKPVPEEIRRFWDTEKKPMAIEEKIHRPFRRQNIRKC